MCLSEKQAKEYKDYLESLAINNSSEMFYNSGKDHAVVLYGVLLKHARLTARFFCEGCMSPIWSDLTFRDAFVDALRREGFSVKILTHKNCSPDFSWLPQELQDKIELKPASEEALKDIFSHFKTSSCNFSVFDSEMFRYEYDVENFKAYGNFNDSEIAGSMINLFDRCYLAS